MGTKYSSNSASGFDATPPADDGTVSEANKVKWSTIKTKLATPVKDLADAINSDLGTHFDRGPTAVTSNTTLGATHFNQMIQVSGSGVTLTLTDAATLDAGWYCDITSTDDTNTVALARATASDMINETSADVTILTLESLRVMVNAAANGFLVDKNLRSKKKNFIGEEIAMSAKSMYWAKGADIASAAPLVLGTDGNYFDVTGTTGFAAITVPAGMLFMLQFDGALTLTHHATNLNLEGGADIVTVAGDRLIGFATAADTVHVLKYIRVDGRAVIGALTRITEVNLTGTTVDFTAIPSWVSRITISFASMSTDGTSPPIIQIGDATSFLTAGYLGSVVTDGATTNHSAGFLLVTSALWAATTIFHGSVVLSKMADTKWACSGNSGDSATAIGFSIAGSNNTLASALTRIRLTATNGSDAFDSGTVNIMYE